MSHPGSLRCFLRRIALRHEAQATDRQLLERFALEQDEAAFVVLVERHGPMVLGVCQRILRHSHDAEDAFQAVFLVLVRRAGTIRQPETLGNWLYGVAYRTALEARSRNKRRQAQQRTLTPLATTPSDHVLRNELCEVLDREINRLPDKYRAAFVLCCLEGRTNDEAAQLLHCPTGTVHSRLSWARQRLRDRLHQRGVALVGFGALVVAVPAACAMATAEAASRFAAGQALNPVSAVTLSLGVLNAMCLPKFKIASLVLLAIALCAGTLLWRGQPTWAKGPSAAANQGQAEERFTGRAVVEQALQAHGGAATLAKLPAVTASLQGKFYGFGQAAPFTGEYASQGSDRNKFMMETEVIGMKLRLTYVLNGAQGWMKVDDATEDLDADELAEAQEEAYGEWVATLVPLTDPAFQVSYVRETAIDQRTVREVKVARQGRRDIHLFFDKQTRLLVKTQTQVKGDDGEETTEEMFLSEYKDVQGTKQAMRFTIKRGGELYLEADITACRLAAKLDDSMFAKP